MHTTSCPHGYGMCVLLKHGLVIVSEWNGNGGFQLHIHSLEDGALVRTIQGQNAHGKEQLDFNRGGLCVTPNGDNVLVAERWNDRVQEVRVAGADWPSPWIRFVGQGVLSQPEHVDCNDKVIVVSETYHDRISVLSWRPGHLMYRLGSQLKYPRGVRLAVGCPTGASSLIVADAGNDRLCVFSLAGEFLRAMGSGRQGLRCLTDVLECKDGFIVANWGRQNLVKVSVACGVIEVYLADSTFSAPSALAALPDGGLVVREWGKFHVFRGLGLRVEWITACVSLARK